MDWTGFASTGFVIAGFVRTGFASTGAVVGRRVGLGYLMLFTSDWLGWYPWASG